MSDIAHNLLTLIPRAPDRIATPQLHRLLAAQGIERTPRAIQLELQSLSGRYPLRCIDTSKPYQWQWPADAPHYEFPPMNAHEAITLKLAKTLLAPLLPRSTLAHLERRTKRADEVLRQAAQLSAWTRKVRVFPRGVPLRPPTIEGPVLAAVYDALLDGRCLEASYRRWGHEEDDAMVVHPLALIVRGSLLTMMCTIEPSTGVRQLHLHRFRSAKVTKHAARAPKGFDVDEEIRSGNVAFRLGEAAAKLRALFSEKAAHTFEETPLADDQRLTKRRDGRVLLEATVADTIELRAWLLGYGPEVEVLAPKAIRDHVAHAARKVAAIYEPPR